MRQREAKQGVPLPVESMGHECEHQDSKLSQISLSIVCSDEGLLIDNALALPRHRYDSATQLIQRMGER